MAKKDLDPKEIEKRAKETAEVVEDALRNISSQIGDIFRDALDTSSDFAKTLTNDITKGINNLARTSTILLSNQEQLNSGSLTREKVEKQIADRTAKVAAIQQQINIAKKAGLITDEEAKDQLKAALDYEKEFIDDLNKQADLADKFNKTLGLTGKLAKGVNKIPILGSLIDSEKVLKRVQKESAKEGATRTSVFKEGFKAIGSSMKENLTDPLVQMGIIGNVIKFILDAMLAADNRVTDIAKNFMITKDAAASIYSNLTDSKENLDTIYRTTANIVEAFGNLSQLSDFISFATKKQIETQIVFTKQLGLTNEEALDTQRLFSINNIEADKGVDITYEQIAAFANQNKLLIDGRKVLTEVGKLSKSIQINFRGNYKELVNTVLEAKKLGFTLDQVSKIGESLLNFEQSISSEIEAELVTGRELNLEEARRYALNNDLLGLTKEIGKQGISYERFSRMNRIQQESIAKALGLQANELADSLYRSKIIQKEANGYTERLKEQADIIANSGDREEASKLRILATSIEQGIVDGKSLEAAQKQASAQEKFQLAVERVKELFTDLFTGGIIDKLADGLEKIVANLENGTGLFAQFLGFGMDDTEFLTKKLEKQKEELKELNAQYAAATGYEKDRLKMEIEAKEAKIKTTKEKLGIKEKEYIESLPAGSSERRRAENDAAGQVTAVGMDEKLATGGIVRKPTRALVGEAGPEAVVPLNKFYAKLDELIASNKMVAENTSKGGNVYLDATKVGTAMTVGTYKL